MSVFDITAFTKVVPKNINEPSNFASDTDDIDPKVATGDTTGGRASQAEGELLNNSNSSDTPTVVMNGPLSTIYTRSLQKMLAIGKESSAMIVDSQLLSGDLSTIEEKKKNRTGANSKDRLFVHAIDGDTMDDDEFVDSRAALTVAVESHKYSNVVLVVESDRYNEHAEKLIAHCKKHDITVYSDRNVATEGIFGDLIMSMTQSSDMKKLRDAWPKVTSASPIKSNIIEGVNFIEKNYPKNFSSIKKFEGEPGVRARAYIQLMAMLNLDTECAFTDDAWDLYSNYNGVNGSKDLLFFGMKFIGVSSVNGIRNRMKNIKLHNVRVKTDGKVKPVPYDDYWVPLLQTTNEGELMMVVFIDGNPTSSGKAGQIVVYDVYRKMLYKVYDSLKELVQAGLDNLKATTQDKAVSTEGLLDIFRKKEEKKQEETGYKRLPNADRVLSIEENLDRIKEWSKLNNEPQVLKDFRPPASSSEISKLEKAVGKSLPSDYVAFLKLHNGFDWSYKGYKDEDFYFMDFNTAEETRSQLEFQISFYINDESEAAECAKYKIEHSPEIQGVWYDALWVPIADDGGGNHLCIDLHPTSKGKVGQILWFWHDWEGRYLQAGSFTEFFHIQVEKTFCEKVKKAK